MTLGSMVSAFKTSGSACTRPRGRRIIEFRDTGPAGGHVSSRHVHRYFLELEIIIRARHARVVLFTFASPIYSLILRISLSLFLPIYDALGIKEDI